MTLPPFSFKIIPNDSIRSGIFSCPAFCKRNKNNNKCLNFYKKIYGKNGLHKCPYGFGVEYFSQDNIKIFFTCLNVESISDRKEIRRHLSTQDFTPRLPLSEYLRIRDDFINTLKLGSSPLNGLLSFESEKSDFQLKEKLLENTIHEIRKLNNQMKNSVHRLTNSINKLDNKSKTEHIENNNLDIYSIANLISIRLDSYDFEVNPLLSLQESIKPIPIFKKIEKVYKCLRSQLSANNIIVNMQGESYKTFSGRNIIEIAFFIILENAIKYSPRDKNKEINITFTEVNEKLTVKFTSWGIRPDENKKNIKKLFNRSYRSDVVEKSEIEGRGIGLYLLAQICNNNNITYEIKIGKDYYYESGYKYSPFSVILDFNNMSSNND